jgi:hypothetical protein
MTLCPLLTHPPLDAVFADTEALRYFSERAISLFNRTDNSLSQIYGIRLHSSPTLAIPHCPLSECKPLYQPGQLQLTLSGSAASRSEQVQANFVLVTLQEQDLTLQSDLAWRDVRTIQPDQQSTIDNLMVWVSRFSMSDLPNSNQYRLLIREYELLMSDRINSLSAQEKRLIYSETILLDEAR